MFQGIGRFEGDDRMRSFANAWVVSSSSTFGVSASRDGLIPSRGFPRVLVRQNVANCWCGQSQLHVFETSADGLHYLCGKLGCASGSAHGTDDGNDEAGLYGWKGVLYV